MPATASLAAAIELHDVSTPGHNARVADLAVAIGAHLGLNKSNLLILARAALLHDLGNLGVPRSLLHKPSTLTDEEWAVIKKHPILGLEILSLIGDLSRERAIILAHHERIDGSGYPNALTGDKVSQEDRILAVADTYCAIIADRPYRRGLGTTTALAVLQAQRGQSLDADCVDALLAVLDESILPSTANRRTGHPNRRFLGVFDRRLRHLVGASA
jgi:HD-GYP domain-containing protein (c-di-GMP phosphodiesterase class II)